MIKDYFVLAYKNLKHRGLRSWLTMLGIFVGIAAVVSLISLSNGLQEAVLGQFDVLSPDTLIVQSSGTSFGPPGSGAVRKLTEHDLDLIASVNGVDMAIPRLLRTVKIEFNKVIGFKYVTSIPGDPKMDNLMYKVLNIGLSEGRRLNSEDKGKILVGADLIKKEEFDKQIEIGSRIKIQNSSFEVVGIMEKTSSLIINNIGVITQKELEDALNISDELDIIMVKVVDKSRTEEVAGLIKKAMRRDRDQKEGEEDFVVQTPIQALSSINTILTILNIIVSGIAAVSLIIGGIGIANTMYTSVLERTREIGVMKAIGGKNSEILTVFVIEAGLLGLVGGIIGAIIGLAFAFGVAYAANVYLGQQLLVVAISYPLVFLSIGFSFIIGLVSGIMPALQASELKPVQALRGQK